MNNVRTFPACRNGLCSQGNRPCPTPQACQVPEHEAWPHVPRFTSLWRGLTPAGRFWLGYLAGWVSVAWLMLGVHFGAGL